MKKFQYIISVFVFILAPLSRAQVIYTNIGSGGPFNAASGSMIGGSRSQEIAIRFTAQSTLLLDYAELQIWGQFGSVGTPAINVALLADAANLPGGVLETSFATFPFLLQNPNPKPLVHVEFSNSLLLSAGVNYWLAVSPANATTQTAWSVTPTFGRGAFDFDQIGFTDPWTDVSSRLENGMRVIGVTAVPEPSTYGLFGSALLIGCIALRRYLKRV